MIDLRVGEASGRAECKQGLEMLQKIRGSRPITVVSAAWLGVAAYNLLKIAMPCPCA
jgi:hypothetical protein